MNESSLNKPESFTQMRRRTRRRFNKALRVGYHPDWINRPQNMTLDRLLKVEHECRCQKWRPQSRIRL